MNPLYTHTGVHLPLAAKLPAVQPLQIIVARWSITGDQNGSAGQRTATFKTYGDDPDITAISQIPSEAWDPSQPDAGAQHGITWIHLSDLHHTLHQEVPVAAVVCRGTTVFVSVTLSATKFHIFREDGSRENGTTWLYLSLLNNYLSAEVMRWVEDKTRAARSGVNWAQIIDRCLRRHTLMGFGGKDYDLSDPGDRVQLGILTALSSEDDTNRRMHLTGKRVAKMDAGGAAVPPEGMPRGWLHAQDQYGRRTKHKDQGFTPDADPHMIPVFQEIYPRYAAGTTFQDLAPLLTEYEDQGLLVRRDPGDPSNSYQGLADAPASRKHDAIKPFFYIKGTRPAEGPTEESIQAYLDGADPADVFDTQTRLYIARLELVRTGTYFRRLENDIPGIGRKGVDGYLPTMNGDDDEYGAFYVQSEQWPWPVATDGVALPSFGVEDIVIRRCVARLLRRLLKDAGPRGGRHRRDGQRRLLQNFNGWTTQPGDPISVYDNGPTSWGVRSRTQNSGKNTFSIMHRPGDVTGAWKYLSDASSASLAELTASLSAALDAEARLMLEPEAVVTVQVADSAPDRAAALNRRLREFDAEAKELKELNAGLRRLAAKAITDEDHGRVAELEEDERANKARLAVIAVDQEALEAQIEQVDAVAASEQGVGHLNLWAHLVVVLERAAGRHGLGSQRDGRLCDKTFEDWSFRPDAEGISWSCRAQLPLVGGTVATVPLTGRVRNLRNAVANQRDQVVRYIFADGRQVDDVAGYLSCGRRALYNRYVMPWLRDSGITATGAKCALVDHPFGLVRKIVWAAVTGQGTSRFPVTPGYLEGLTEVYLNPNTQWGGTTVPDDTTRPQRALDILSGPDVNPEEGMTVAELALILGCTEEKVRDLARPRHRNAGFKRPGYLEYTSHTKDRVRHLTCPQDGTAATHVALFPEVAASGFGVLCPKCRRAPTLQGPWPQRVFPEQYLSASYTRAPGKGSIVDSARTVLVE